MSAPFPEKSLIVAPMEGITDEAYRLAINEACPDWDYYYTDFLRLPSSGHYSAKKIVDHFGATVSQKTKLKGKTGYQILTAINAHTEDHARRIFDLGYQHLDLNLGCPSKKVNGHRGGAYLLKDLEALTTIVKKIRDSYPGYFSAKIRVGFDDDKNFITILKTLEDLGAQSITIHGRTKAQQYEGRANWDYIKDAVKAVNVPIIGNGDVWTVEDVIRIFDYTDCHSIMLGRGAMKTPWLATEYSEYKQSNTQLPQEILLQQRKEHLSYFLFVLEKYYRRAGLTDDKILKRFKALSRYTFDDYDIDGKTKSRFLRTQELHHYQDLLQQL